MTEALILHDEKEGVVVASEQLTQMKELYASIKERMSKPDIVLATIRDILENLHLAAIEPEAVTYAEVDADGVPARRTWHEVAAPGLDCRRRHNRRMAR